MTMTTPPESVIAALVPVAAMRRALICAPKIDIRPALPGLWVQRVKGRGDMVSATDGHTAFTEWLPDGSVSWGATPDDACSFMVPYADAAGLIKHAGRHTDHAMLTIGRGATLQARATVGTLSMEVAQPTATMVDIMRVFAPLVNAPNRVALPAMAVYVAEQLARVAAIARVEGNKDTSGPMLRVYLELSSSRAAFYASWRDAVGFSTSDGDGWRAARGGAWAFAVTGLREPHEGDGAKDVFCSTMAGMDI